MKKHVFHQSDVVALRVLPVILKAGRLIEALASVSFAPFEIFEVHFDCAGSQKLVGAFLDALAVALCAFSGLVALFVTGARETSCLGPKSAFHGRRRGSERFY